MAIVPFKRSPTAEEVIDAIYDRIDIVPPATALEALTACVTGIVERCDDPARALLAVIAELTTMVRFSETPDGEDVPTLEDWMASAWAE